MMETVVFQQSNAWLAGWMRCLMPVQEFLTRCDWNADACTLHIQFGSMRSLQLNYLQPNNNSSVVQRLVEIYIGHQNAHARLSELQQAPLRVVNRGGHIAPYANETRLASVKANMFGDMMIDPECVRAIFDPCRVYRLSHGIGEEMEISPVRFKAYVKNAVFKKNKLPMKSGDVIQSGRLVFGYEWSRSNWSNATLSSDERILYPAGEYGYEEGFVAFTPSFDCEVVYP